MRRHCIKAQAAVELAIFGSIILVAFSVLLMYGQRLDSQQQVKMEAFRRALQKAYEQNASVSYTLKKESRAANLFGGFGQGQASTVGSTATVMWQKGMSGEQGNNKAETFAYYVINDNEIGSEIKDGKPTGKGLPRYPKKQPSPTGGSGTGDKYFTAHVPVTVWNEEQVRQEEYSATAQKQELPGGKIINTKKSDLKDTINVTLHTRVDKSVKSDYWGEEPMPEYVYEGNYYTYEKPNDQKVEGIAPVSLGAYARDDTNRIDYSADADKVGTTIHKEKQWQTEK